MKFYIASRVKNKELVKEMHKILEKKGHTVSSSWVTENNIIPYEQNEQAARERAIQCIKESGGCDVFILITDTDGAGMYTELGAAIYANFLSGKPNIYVVGKFLSRSMFFFYPGIKRVTSLEKVLEDIRYL